MTAPDIGEIIDLDRYPIDRPASSEYEALLARGRQSLQEKALFTLPQFIREPRVLQMAQELEALVARSARYDQARNAYSDGFDADDHGDDHPHRRRHRCAYNQLLNYQIPNNALLRQVYLWQPLTEFLGILCGYDSFYRSDCPHLALTAKIAGDGDADGWHYDGNDVVFSILLQAPESGGLFEYAPYIRSEDDENYAAVAALFDDPESKARRPQMQPGNLTVFKGDLSMHRVSPVRGARKRIVALFSYDRQPGMVFDQWYIEQLQQSMAE